MKGYMSTSVEEYESKTPNSKALYEKAVTLFPGGICHDKRYFHPYPFYVDMAKGSKIWDVDRNKYIDYWMGHFALILGHSPSPVTESLTEQIGKGTHWGTVNELQIELAIRIKRNVRCADMVRFCNSGMEANTYAVRLARGYTGKKVVLKAEGGWHGFTSDLLIGINKEFEESESMGLLPDFSNYVKTIPFNDLEGTMDVIRSEESLAAVVIEPVIGSGGFIPADREYLSALKEEADSKEFLLIFDEIITGFRLGLGGAQDHYGVVPNLTVLGKIIGGGLPIGAIVGEDQIMALADPTAVRRKSEKVKIGGGTFSCNPMTMKAGIATIDRLEEDRRIYTRIASMGECLRQGYEKILRDNGLPAVATGVGSLFHFHTPNRDGVSIRSPRDAVDTANEDRSREIFLRLVNKGFFIPRLNGCISSAHTKEENEELLIAISEEVREV